jgi:hypothetical protein
MAQDVKVSPISGVQEDTEGPLWGITPYRDEAQIRGTLQTIGGAWAWVHP